MYKQHNVCPVPEVTLLCSMCLLPFLQSHLHFLIRININISCQKWEALVQGISNFHAKDPSVAFAYSPYLQEACKNTIEKMLEEQRGITIPCDNSLWVDHYE